MNLTAADWIIGAAMFVLGFFVAPAFGHVTETAAQDRLSLRQLREKMNSQVEGIQHRARIRRANRTSAANDDNTSLWLAVLLFLAIVGLYVKYQQLVLFGVIVVVVFLTALTAFCLWRMSRYGVVTGGRGLSNTFLLIFCAASVGLVNVAFLQNPPAGGEEFRTFMQNYATDGLVSDGILLIAYQVIGIGSYLVVAVASIAFCVAILAALYFQAGAWGRPVWRYVYYGTSGVWGVVPLVVASVMAILSIFLCGGWVYDWIGGIQQVEIPLPTVS